MTQEEIVMKKETLEEAAIRTFDEFKLKNPIVPESAIYPYKLGFAKGTTWQQERMYSEEDMIEFGEWCENLQKDNKEIRRSNPSITTKELLQIWKEQKPKIVYYG